MKIASNQLPINLYIIYYGLITNLADSFQLEINDLEIINAIKYSDNRQNFLGNEKLKIDKIILLVSKMFEAIIIDDSLVSLRSKYQIIE